MHELSITQNIVGLVAERAGDRPVERVRLRIGKLSGVEVEAIRFCFDVVARGTLVEGAELVVEEVDGRAHCETCGADVPLDALVLRCGCGRGGRLRLIEGEELLVKSMEVTSCAEPADAATETE